MRKDGMPVEANRVYVIPPDADLAILHGQLQVLKPAAARGLRTPVDFFFRQLAEDQKEKAIGIILSGMGSDGALGLRAIKEHLGMAMAQEPASAKYDGMPRSAIGTGMVDCVAAAEELPAKLLEYVRHRPTLAQKESSVEEEAAGAMGKVFVLLRAHGGNDFSCYKSSTIVRRMERRMGIHLFDSVARYVRFPQENPQELELLHKELFIGVTNFFREAEMFDFLKEEGLGRVLADWPAGRPLRVWNPASSTGEETYSLAMTLIEGLEALKLRERPRIQVFATDIDPEAIEHARRGKYAAGIAVDVSEELHFLAEQRSNLLTGSSCQAQRSPAKIAIDYLATCLRRGCCLYPSAAPRLCVLSASNSWRSVCALGGLIRYSLAPSSSARWRSRSMELPVRTKTGTEAR